ncbi:xanthine dehydrogenase family protein molybdopterin-binding subunit [Desulfosarcina ovata]|uniref:Carbon-monoxide dehydrogenase large subunit n=1 Tax=Desulfosarcina ovata subsp. ovata TaxID=2752305 RepID=A0A5K8AFI2_9BACT|nr:xanthine dehydrogenase family protein molybdopterin-binding subunit [Desulfosarcina ovata]BBO91341.1 carbon-monoxide dehydrogenase large subunit [Desulfosarcina ovata subsp. ovata]
MPPDHRVYQIGEAMPRSDALGKATGAEKFSIDTYGNDLLWAGVKRGGVPHARIRGIDIQAAQTTPGVRAVLTARDVNGTNRQGVIRKDQPVLADDRVRHCGDAVALVVAESSAALEAALDRIVLDLDPLEAIFDPEAALRDDAPLIHPDHAGGNTLFHATIQNGDPQQALSDCDAVVEGCFDLPRQAHAFLETENGWALADDEGRLDITVSTQTPFRDRLEVAEALGLAVDRIRIRAPFCGGAFGGKDGITVQSLLALAALSCPGRPVKMWWRREESFLAGVKRHPARLYYRLGADRDGTLKAVSARIYLDTGPYDHLGGVVAALGLEHAGGPYRIPHADLAVWAAYTNNPVSGAFRGFGVPQVAAAMESMMDMVAAKLRICPLALRRKNALVRGDRCPAGVTRQGSVGLLECLKTLEAHPLWKEREHWKASAGPNTMRGTGIACISHGMGYGPTVPDSATAGIRLMDDGRFEVMAGVVDMGQGNAAAYLQMAGDILSQPPGHLIPVLPDTDKTFPSGSSSASRTTFTYGNALIGAARALKERIFARAADALMVSDTSALILVPGAVRHLATGREITLSRLGMFLNPAERFATYHYRAPVSGEAPHPDGNLRLHGFPHSIFSHAAHLVRVEVDALTGQVSVPEYLGVNDCGRILNPQNFSGQQEGAVVQGLGYALYEEVIADKGRMMTRDFTTYIIPTALDAPKIESVAVALAEEAGPFGLKGAGEIGIDIPLPAVANALFDACGVRLLKFPMTPERILTALVKKDAP